MILMKQKCQKDMSEDFISVVPTVSQLLEVTKDVKCSFEGCSKTFSNKGNLHMHLIKSHGEIKNERDASIYHASKGAGPSVRYHCPVEPCMYNKGAKKFWSTFQLVRQHYKRVHAERKFVCSKCSSKFSCDYDLNRHLTVCGVMYGCGSCPVKYTTKEALLMHCKRETTSIQQNTSDKRKKRAKRIDHRSRDLTYQVRQW